MTTGSPSALGTEDIEELVGEPNTQILVGNGAGSESYPGFSYDNVAGTMALDNISLTHAATSLTARVSGGLALQLWNDNVYNVLNIFGTPAQAGCLKLFEQNTNGYQGVCVIGPVSLDNEYNIRLPDAIGEVGDILQIVDITSANATLAWTKPSVFVHAEPPDRLNDTTTPEVIASLSAPGDGPAGVYELVFTAQISHDNTSSNYRGQLRQGGNPLGKLVGWEFQDSGGGGLAVDGDNTGTDNRATINLRHMVTLPVNSAEQFTYEHYTQNNGVETSTMDMVISLEYKGSV